MDLICHLNLDLGIKKWNGLIAFWKVVLKGRKRDINF